MPEKKTGTGAAVRRAPDGTFRWTYEMSMLKHPLILFTTWKVLGAVCGAVFTPCMAVKGLFDTFTLGAFVDEDYDITDTTDIVEDKVDFVNDIATLNNPFEDDEEVIEIVVEEEEEAETEEEPEPETETEEE